MKFRRPSPALVIACVALFAAFSGGAYAAKVKLGKNAVKTKNIKKNAVTSAKIRSNAVKTADIANGAITDTKLAPGAGDVPAYAHVTYNGTAPQVDAAHSKNVTVTKSGTDDGLVCVDSTVPIKSASANVENTGPATIGVAEIAIPAASPCPASADALVRTKTVGTGDANLNFYVTFVD
jgi:hypothetical protein